MRHLLFILILVTVGMVSASEDPVSALSDQELNQQILAADSVLFEDGFNACDLSIWRNKLADDLEFYDDRSGLNADINKEIASFQNKCSAPIKITRTLLESRVSRLNHFGAVQIGKHEFYEDGKRTGDAEFIHLWELTADGWKVKRVVSFAH